MSNEPSSTRRILSRSKQNDDADTHSSSHSSRSKPESSSRTSSVHVKPASKVTTSSSSNSVSSSSSQKDVKNIEMKSEPTTGVSLGASGVAEVSFSSVTNTQTQNQQQIAHNLAISYINKEPFNEDIEIEECTNFQDVKWRKMVFENFKQIIEDIQKLQLDPLVNVSFSNIICINLLPISTKS